MAHEITERDGMFTVRQPAWHGLGTVLEDYPTLEEARKIAHPWEPVSEPLYRAVPSFEEIRSSVTGAVIETVPTTRYEQVSGFVANVRDDDGHLLGVTSDTYQLVSNAEMYEIAEAIEGEAKGEVMLETGGSLKGGSKVWLLIRLRDPLVINGDPLTATIPYYALQNSHDGSGSFRGQATMTRIVCDNTAQMADLDATARGTQFVFNHTLNVGQRIEEAKKALLGWRESVDTYQRMTEHLLDLRVTQKAAWQFVEEFIPMPKPGTASERVQNNVRTAQEEMWNILHSETCEAISHTAFGLVQSAVEYLNHARTARTNETRFKRAYLDQNKLVTDAVTLAQQFAGVSA